MNQSNIFTKRNIILTFTKKFIAQKRWSRKNCSRNLTLKSTHQNQSNLKTSTKSKKQHLNSRGEKSRTWWLSENVFRGIARSSRLLTINGEGNRSVRRFYPWRSQLNVAHEIDWYRSSETCARSRRTKRWHQKQKNISTNRGLAEGRN